MLPATEHGARTAEAEEHQRPGGGFGNGGRRFEVVETAVAVREPDAEIVRVRLVAGRCRAALSGADRRDVGGVREVLVGPVADRKVHLRTTVQRHTRTRHETPEDGVEAGRHPGASGRERTVVDLLEDQLAALGAVPDVKTHRRRVVRPAGGRVDHVVEREVLDVVQQEEVRSRVVLVAQNEPTAIPRQLQRAIAAPRRRARDDRGASHAVLTGRIAPALRIRRRHHGRGFGGDDRRGHERGDHSYGAK